MSNIHLALPSSCTPPCVTSLPMVQPVATLFPFARSGLAPVGNKALEGDTHAKTPVLRRTCDVPAADYPTRSIRIKSSRSTNHSFRPRSRHHRLLRVCQLRP